MKHIKRKFLKEHKVNFDASQVIDSIAIQEGQDNIGYKVIEQGSHYPTIITDQNEIIQAFFYKAGKKIFIIPEPHLISVYFDIAQSQFKHLNFAKVDLLRSIEANQDVGKSLNLTHSFFHYSCICGLFLFNSMEAFINLLLPTNKEYIKKEKGHTGHYSHEEIQRQIPFEEKIKDVLPQFFNKSFQKEYGHKYETIIKLKELRDEIVHTKAFTRNDDPNYYKQIFTKLLDFDFQKALFHTRDFINYFEHGLIEECDCGRKE